MWNETQLKPTGRKYKISNVKTRLLVRSFASENHAFTKLALGKSEKKTNIDVHKQSMYYIILYPNLVGFY